VRSAILFLLVACGGSIEEPLHDVIDCQVGGGQCERACADPVRDPDQQNCVITIPAGTGDCGVVVVDFEGLRGCCRNIDDDVVRFVECE
jgi:hypothetical protein